MADLIEKARELFIKIAGKYGLALEWDQSASVELAASLPKQTGLDWSLWLNVQNNDEIGFQSSFFTAEWFPLSNSEVQAEFLAILDGVISGEIRLNCRFSRSGRQPYEVRFETLKHDKWQQVYSYARGVYFSKPAGQMILRNGYPAILEGSAVGVPMPE